MRFEEIEHTADRAFRVQGRTFAELLENAARAMSSLDGLGPSGEPSVVRTIEVEGIDRETLLVNWLNEILYLEQTRGEAYDRFQILESSNLRLHARLDGRQSGGWVSHIKAATFHDLAIKQTPEGLEGTIVFDV
jgi:SHS2 domain-containing protein